MKLYGLDYNMYVCGGIGNRKFQLMGSETLLFYSESEMLDAVAKLKSDCTIGEIKPFVTYITKKEKYEF